MPSASRSRWTIVFAISAGAVGLWMLVLQRDAPNLTDGPASNLGIIASPQSVVVERPEGGGTSLVKFTLRNTAKKSVFVQSVETSCGCSVAQPMADQTIRPGNSQSLVISAEPPAFDSRNVNVYLQIVDSSDSTRKETIRLQMKLVGKPIPRSRVYDLPTVVEMSQASSGEVVRNFQFNTMEESEDSKWITGLSSTSAEIEAQILSCESNPISKERIQRTYHCRLAAKVPRSVDEVLAGTVRLMSGNSAASESSTFRVVARRRAAWKAYPSVIMSPPRDATEDITQSVAVQAVDIEDAESLRRLEIAHAPKGVIVEWLPSDEQQLRKLSVKVPLNNRSDLASAETISLHDPESRDPLEIRFAP